MAASSQWMIDDTNCFCLASSTGACPALIDALHDKNSCVGMTDNAPRATKSPIFARKA